ncbi:hypothetical protein BDF14DRAFT_1817048 [Spinellus fusiger]|nr:hypothetical protein BDF14DRAFT_1817048 [Spinellus fusiger]
MPVQSKLAQITSRSGLPLELQPALATLLRAYGLGWALTTVPVLLVILVKRLFKVSTVKHSIAKALRESITRNGLPFIMAGAFGGHKFLSFVLRRYFPQWNAVSLQRLALLTSTATTLHTVRRLFPTTKTLDLTLLAFSRALDVFAHKASGSPLIREWVPQWIIHRFSALAFTAVTTQAVWTWMYEPSRLPKSYSQWIAGVSGVDDRVLQVLRDVRTGTYVYGAPDTLNAADGIKKYCSELGIPQERADPLYGRFPCSAVHNGHRHGCEVGALDKFAYVFHKAFSIYFTVHALPPLLFSPKRLFQNPTAGLLHILEGSVRSASFLASLISMIFYIICLIRTRIGHQLLHIPQQYLDSEWTPFVACILSGVSILVESPHRRAEMALYVAPRALQAFLDRYLSPYQKGRWWEKIGTNTVETVVFATSMTVILEAMYTQDTMLRSSIKSLISWILKDELKAAKSAEEKREVWPMEEVKAAKKKVNESNKAE